MTHYSKGNWKLSHEDPNNFEKLEGKTSNYPNEKNF